MRLRKNFSNKNFLIYGSSALLWKQHPICHWFFCLLEAPCINFDLQKCLCGLSKRSCNQRSRCISNNNKKNNCLYTLDWLNRCCFYAICCTYNLVITLEEVSNKAYQAKSVEVTGLLQIKKLIFLFIMIDGILICTRQSTACMPKLNWQKDQI